MLPDYEEIDLRDSDQKSQEHFLSLTSAKCQTDDLAVKPAFSDDKMLSCDHLRTVTLNRGFAAL